MYNYHNDSYLITLAATIVFIVVVVAACIIAAGANVVIGLPL